MKWIWKIVTAGMAALGALLIYGGVSTSDYYVMELGQDEPSYVWRMIWIGCTLLIPAAVRLVKSEWRDHK